MREHRLLLERHTGKPRRIHDGVIITLKSNLRWCSDSFEIRCWNGERVNVAFSLDTCDREAMSFVATTGGISGEMICDLMLAAVEHRFGSDARHVPRAIEWLTDNGSCYTAHETVVFGESLGLLICTTPVYSPESNGMASAPQASAKAVVGQAIRAESETAAAPGSHRAQHLPPRSQPPLVQASP